MTPVRVDALLADLCGPFPRERFLLFHALRERIPTQLVLAHALREHVPAQLVLTHAPRQQALAAHLIHPQWYAICAGWFSQRLQNWYGFSAKAAQWTVESCSSRPEYRSAREVPDTDRQTSSVCKRDHVADSAIMTPGPRLGSQRKY